MMLTIKWEGFLSLSCEGEPPKKPIFLVFAKDRCGLCEVHLFLPCSIRAGAKRILYKSGVTFIGAYNFEGGYKQNASEILAR